MSATYMSRVPSLSELNAILDPSGDHRGSLASSATSECVVCVISEPSAFIIYIYISDSEPVVDTNAIRCPSGDHVGPPVVEFGSISEVQDV